MPRKDRRVDEYIAKSADFAKPILRHLRALVHEACPQAEETLKWGLPHFTHRGLMCYMAGFKAHCSFGFWKRALIFGAASNPAGTKEKAMGHFGKITRLADLPADEVLAGYVKKAAALNEAGIKAPGRGKPAGDRVLVAPDFFMAALRKNKKALATFEAYSYSHKKEYVEWVREAKREETRQRRLEKTVAWLAQGKSRNWRYEGC